MSIFYSVLTAEALTCVLSKDSSGGLSEFLKTVPQRGSYMGNSRKPALCWRTEKKKRFKDYLKVMLKHCGINPAKLEDRAAQSQHLEDTMPPGCSKIWNYNEHKTRNFAGNDVMSGRWVGHRYQISAFSDKSVDGNVHFSAFFFLI